MPFGALVILPMPPAGAHGGAAAEKQLQASLKTFLSPFLNDGAEYPKPRLMHAKPRGAFEEQEYAYFRTSSSDQELPYVTMLDATYSGAATNKTVRFVSADFDADEATLFDVLGMVEPRARDASAVADRAAELETLAAEWEEQRAQTRGQAVLRELTEASQVAWQMHSGAYDYVSRTRDDPSWSRPTPLIRLKSTLVPDAPGSRDGHIEFDIYVQATTAEEDMYSTATTGPRHCRPIFSKSHDERGSAPASALSETISTLMEASSPEFVANSRAMRELKYRFGHDQSVTSIPGLMSAVESQERPEAPQPPGLNATLRPYQRQALGFMLEAEARTNGPFWAEMPLTSGGSSSSGGVTESVFFSPLLMRLTRIRPAAMRGGFLCEEMGACCPHYCNRGATQGVSLPLLRRASLCSVLLWADTAPPHVRRPGQDGHQPRPCARCPAIRRREGGQGCQVRS